MTSIWNPRSFDLASNGVNPVRRGWRASFFGDQGGRRQRGQRGTVAIDGREGIERERGMHMRVVGRRGKWWVPALGDGWVIPSIEGMNDCF